MRFTPEFVAAVAALLVTGADAQKKQGLNGQCGGKGYNGPTDCVKGSYCQTYNEYWSQCVGIVGQEPKSKSKDTPAATSTAASSASSMASPSASTVTSTVTATVTVTQAASVCPSNSAGVSTGSSSGVATATSSSSAAPSETGLHTQYMKNHGKYFGTATDYYEYENDAPYRAIVSDNKMFGWITALNSMKWESTEPSRGVFTLENGDKVANFAEANGQNLRCHTLVWHSQLPKWVSEGGFDNATLISIMENHITTLMTRWKGKCDHWDVVNEAFLEDGTYRKSVFLDTIGPWYIPLAFKFARAADPTAKLYLNDYNIDGTGPKSSLVIKVVKEMQAAGYPIDGIGAQAHFQSEQIAGDIPANWAAFGALGVEVAVTELDIRIPEPITAAKLQKQKEEYNYVVGACTSTPACVGVTIWDYTDKYSWVPGVFAGTGSALPWDENLVKKPAYYGIEEALQ